MTDMLDRLRSAALFLLAIGLLFSGYLVSR